MGDPLELHEQANGSVCFRRGGMGRGARPFIPEGSSECEGDRRLASSLSGGQSVFGKLEKQQVQAKIAFSWFMHAQ